MPVARQFRQRDHDVEVQILDALVERRDEGMTVFELRTHVGADIDDIERALSALKQDGLIDVDEDSSTRGGAVIRVADHVEAASDADGDPSTMEWLRERLPF